MDMSTQHLTDCCSFTSVSVFKALPQLFHNLSPSCCVLLDRGIHNLLHQLSGSTQNVFGHPAFTVCVCLCVHIKTCFELPGQ